MNRASDTQGPMGEFQVPTGGTAGEVKPMCEQGEFDFDALSGSDYVSATPAPEADLGTEDASVTDAEVAEVEEVGNAPAST